MAQILSKFNSSKQNKARKHKSKSIDDYNEERPPSKSIDDYNEERPPSKSIDDYNEERPPSKSKKLPTTLFVKKVLKKVISTSFNFCCRYLTYGE